MKCFSQIKTFTVRMRAVGRIPLMRSLVKQAHPIFVVSFACCEFEKNELQFDSIQCLSFTRIALNH